MLRAGLMKFPPRLLQASHSGGSAIFPEGAIRGARVKLTTKGRYAVQAMADIAANGGAGEQASVVALPDIAARQAISALYLEQLFARLKRAGLVDSVRGVGGGYRLSRSAASIRIADIIEAVDEEIRTTACGGGRAGCRGDGARCLTHDLWDELGRQIGIFLNAVSLDDVTNKRVLGMAAVNPPAARRQAMEAAE
jgi:Rrf2 family iron-sulfur cluster assembly transcriptional regulator